MEMVFLFNVGTWRPLVTGSVLTFVQGDSWGRSLYSFVVGITTGVVG